MRVGILGSSDVAKSVAHGFLYEGHEVMPGSREPGKVASWVRESGKGASSGTFSETAAFAATPNLDSMISAATFNVILRGRE